MTSDEKVRWFYERYQKECPWNHDVTLLDFAKRQAAKTLGTSLYGDPAIYRRWLKKRGLERD